MVDYDSFLAWAEERFYDVVTSGDEVQINSIFKPNDLEHKLWCNPKKGPWGTYHCWKTNKGGNLVQLVREVDGLDWEDAAELLGAGGGATLADLTEKVAEFFTEKIQEQEELKIETVKLELPNNTYLLTDLPSGNPYRQKAETYLTRRKLSINGLYICTQDRFYHDRIVIPYYDRHGKLIYYNCRTLTDAIPKYRGPPKELGIGKHDVLYMPHWPTPYLSDFIFLTEGELDALSISISGMWSAAFGGKSISGIQIDMLGNMRPVIALDRDEAGMGAFLEIGDRLKSMGLAPCYVQPPKGFKDWNDLLVAYNTDIVRDWLMDAMRPYDRAAFLQRSIF